HIYGNVKVNNASDVKQNWEQIKQKEHRGTKSLLAGVPNSMPSLVKAYRMQEKAAQVGFDWENKQQVWAKVEEELAEFKEELGTTRAPGEFGDLLFALVNYARFEGINPDDALELTNRKFKSRFKYIEDKAREQGRNLKEMTLEEMDKIWNEAKTNEI
ncbi:MAG TPA: MazG family protein, partial [Bacteroidia bacterium]|nr:MazG family protein [Bacteroidia bacterium]